MHLQKRWIVVVTVGFEPTSNWIHQIIRYSIDCNSIERLNLPRSTTAACHTTCCEYNIAKDVYKHWIYIQRFHCAIAFTQYNAVLCCNVMDIVGTLFGTLFGTSLNYCLVFVCRWCVSLMRVAAINNLRNNKYCFEYVVVLTRSFDVSTLWGMLPKAKIVKYGSTKWWIFM